MYSKICTLCTLFNFSSKKYPYFGLFIDISTFFKGRGLSQKYIQIRIFIRDYLTRRNRNKTLIKVENYAPIALLNKS